MQGSLLQPDEKRTGITFDPRTKMFLLLTIAVFVLGGAGGKNVDLLAPMLCALPFVLFLLSGKENRNMIRRSWEKNGGRTMNLCVNIHILYLRLLQVIALPQVLLLLNVGVFVQL